MPTLLTDEQLVAKLGSGRKIPASDLRDILYTIMGTMSGWAAYGDSEYTSENPWSLTEAMGVQTMPNNALAPTTIKRELPLDVQDFYDSVNQVLIGRDGDGRKYTIEFKGRPTNVVAEPRLDYYVDIGGGIPPLYPDSRILGRGAGNEHSIVYQPDAYTLNTWELNGGQVKIQADTTIEIYSIRYVCKLDHRSRLALLAAFGA